MKPEFLKLAGTAAVTAGIVQPLVISANIHPPHIPLAGVTCGCVVGLAIVGILLDDILAEFLGVKPTSIGVFCGTVLLSALIASVSGLVAVGNYFVLKIIGTVLLGLLAAAIALVVHLRRGGVERDYDQTFDA